MLGRRSFLAVLLLGATAPVGCRSKRADGVTDLEGAPVDPFAGDAKVVVLFFVSTDCPISNRYAPEIRRLARELGARGVGFWLVYPTAEETSAMIRDHAREYALTLPILRDPRHALVAHAKVTVTPESAVFGRGGALAYHGRIDDRQVDFGEARPEATRHDLEEAIDAVLAGGAPSHDAAPAIGCAITQTT